MKIDLEEIQICIVNNNNDNKRIARHLDTIIHTKSFMQLKLLPIYTSDIFKINRSNVIVR